MLIWFVYARKSQQRATAQSRARDKIARDKIAGVRSVLLHRESKKTRHQTLGHNFTNYYPIFKISSLADSAVNLQQIRV